MSHPEMDFSIFGDVELETVEEFKARATSSLVDPIPSAEEALGATSQTEPAGNLELPTASSPPHKDPPPGSDQSAQN